MARDRINEALQKDIFYLRQLARQPMPQMSSDLQGSEMV